jgi:L-lactate dehydrogenase complex protein LldG
MSGAREAILVSLASARPPAAPDPVRVDPPAMPPDPMRVLGERVGEAGGRFQRVPRPGWPDRIEWPIDLAAVEHLYSVLPELAGRGVGRRATSDRELECLDVCVLRAEFAVVENGAAWHVPSDPRERVAALLAQHLVVVVDAAQLVPTLHQAYERIDLERIDFGWFLCGPSKTADIEQSLVLGAHGARTMSLVVLEDEA